MDQAPSAPTMVESGYPDFVTGSWQGVFVPAGTPREVVDKLFKAIQQTMSAPEVAERLKNGGAEVLTSATPAAFAGFVAAETQRWARVVRESNATVD
jgi:tripartite-type tricarboxylate transporter receptor subunit TctC